MSRQLLTFALALPWLQAANADVTVDISKLTDFSTTITFNVKDLVADMRQTGDAQSFEGLDPSLMALLQSDMVVQGKLIANIPGEKMKIKLDMSAVVPPGPQGPPGPVKDTFVLTFDGPKGYVAMENSASIAVPLSDVTGAVCVKDMFPSGMLPPPEQVMAMVNQQAPMANMIANQMPHAIKGDLAYYVLCVGGCVSQGNGQAGPGPIGDTVLALRVADGTPVAFWGLGVITSPESAANLVQGVTPAIKFGDFAEVEDFSEVQCVSPSTQMLDQPRSKVALFLSEQLLKRLQLAAPIASATRHMFGQFPHVLRNTKDSCVAPAEGAIVQAATAVEPSAFFSTAALCMVSAAVGAGIAVTLAPRAFSKTEPVYLEIS